MKCFFSLIFLFPLFASASNLNQSFFCSHKDGGIYYLQLDFESNIGVTTVSGKDAFYGKYFFKKGVLTIDVPDGNFFEKSVSVKGSETFIYRFETESLRCHGVKS